MNSTAKRRPLSRGSVASRNTARIKMQRGLIKVIANKSFKNIEQPSQPAIMADNRIIWNVFIGFEI